MQIYLWICSVLFFAGFTKGISGFGTIIVSIPLLTIFLDIRTVIPLVALSALSMSLLLLVQLRQYFDWKKVYPFMVGAVPGIPVGVFFLKRIEKGAIFWVLGSILIAYGLSNMLIRSSKRGIRQNWVYPFAFLAGCLGGAFSAPGPPVIVYTSLQAWNKEQIRVTLQGFFLISGAIIVFFHAINGLITWAVLRFYGVSFPSLILGAYAGSLFYRMIDEKTYRGLMFVMLCLLGALMIYRA
jgi:uncharacterized membrane protein YfcA